MSGSWVTSPAATQANLMWTVQSKVSREKNTEGVGLGERGWGLSPLLDWQRSRTKNISNPSRVLSRIYRLGEKSWVSKGEKLLRGVSWKFFEMKMRWDAIWCILRHNFEKCYSVCTDLVTSGWFFRYNYSYTVIITIFWGGEAGHFGGGSFYPSNTLDRTLPMVGLQGDKVGEMRLQLKINYTGVPSSLPLISLLPLFFLCSPFCVIRHCLNVWNRLHIYSVVQC